MMSKPRKKYRPRLVEPDPVGYVLHGFKKLDAKHPAVMNLSISVHQAATALVGGTAGKGEMDFLLTAANVAAKLIEQGIGLGYEEVAHEGRKAVVELARRGWQTERFIAKGPELTAINALLELHDAQFEVVTFNDFDQAVRAMIKDIRAGRVPSIESLSQSNA